MILTVKPPIGTGAAAAYIRSHLVMSKHVNDLCDDSPSSSCVCFHTFHKWNTEPMTNIVTVDIRLESL